MNTKYAEQGRFNLKQSKTDCKILNTKTIQNVV